MNTNKNINMSALSVLSVITFWTIATASRRDYTDVRSFFNSMKSYNKLGNVGFSALLGGSMSFLLDALLDSYAQKYIKD